MIESDEDEELVDGYGTALKKYLLIWVNDAL
jgi:hypothetical protein